MSKTIEAIIFDFGRVISVQKPMSLFLGYEEELGLEPSTINPIMFGSWLAARRPKSSGAPLALNSSCTHPRQLTSSAIATTPTRASTPTC